MPNGQSPAKSHMPSGLAFCLKRWRGHEWWVDVCMKLFGESHLLLGRYGTNQHFPAPNPGAPGHRSRCRSCNEVGVSLPRRECSGCRDHCRLEAIASRLETIASTLEAIACRLETIACTLIASRLEAIARLEPSLLGSRPSLLGWRQGGHHY